MDFIKENIYLIGLILTIVVSVTAIVLSSSAKNIPGKNWLVASIILWLLGIASNFIIQIATRALSLREVVDWYQVTGFLFEFRDACFVIFLFALWSNSRLKLNIKNLLFSFNGRISRAAFWLIGLILFPLGMTIGLTVVTTETEGLVNVILWIVYFCWLIISIWISLSVYAKRLHDCGKSGWMTLILFIPIIGALWLIIYLGFTKGSIDENEYGEDTILLNKQVNISTENA